jgi:2-C-methyl-D-erythritol 4-phosphate cytidylyltransferase / 2-C-methyl-D-erythritol 2,4-cyclodiphosphate synthase
LQTAVIIVAAGRGTRAGGTASGIPKQYRPLAGLPVIAHSLETFTRHRRVDAILPVIQEADRSLFEQVSAGFQGRLMDAVCGGDTRQQSVHAGLAALARHVPANVLIHDAARPFVSDGIISRVIEALDDAAGAVPALPVADTLKRVTDGRIAETLDRSGLWAAQTPQGFRFDAILEAHAAAVRSGRTDFTDDASIAEWQGLEVALVEGDACNMKLTTAEDFALAEHRLTAGETRIGQGYDVHAFTIGDQVMLCGVSVAHDRALAGHSDADVGLHAITDALLGAIGDGDIGRHFPPSDPQWRGAASDIFLKDAARRIAERGGRIVNIDVTLICEAPKIGPHARAMRERIAEILEIEIERVGVKATTTEGLGFTGRKEGIAAIASASVRLP